MSRGPDAETGWEWVMGGVERGGAGITRSWLASPWRFSWYTSRLLPGLGRAAGTASEWPQVGRPGRVGDAAQPSQGELPPPPPRPLSGQVQAARLGLAVPVGMLPARGRPPQAAARRAGLEVVEKLLTTKLTSSVSCLG
jgi:hypothetical protein